MLLQMTARTVTDGFVPFLLFWHYLNISFSIQLHYHILQIVPKLIKLQRVSLTQLRSLRGLRSHLSVATQFSDLMSADEMIQTYCF